MFFPRELTVPKAWLSEELMSRDDFRNGVFFRDYNECVVCKAPAQDAHHILERRLWPDGGYYLNNGASLCGECHIKAETTEYSVEFIREKAGITKPMLPPHLYRDQPYDKWGNPVLANGTRLKGDLFNDASVQKILGSRLSLFSDHVKYPRTYHLPWSPGLTKDDRVMPDINVFMGQEVVVTLKMDGENTTMYNDYVHARSLNYEPHASRALMKALQGRKGYEIPLGWRVCGENLFAKHSIHYTDLKSYFQVFSIWDETNHCLSWDETTDYAGILDLPMVDTIYRGNFNQLDIEAAFEPYRENHEGYVVRNAGKFHYGQFRNNVGKYVRANHVHTHGHWMRQQVVPNKLA